MLKKLLISIVLIVVMLGSATTYFLLINSEYKSMIRFSGFLIPQKSILVVRDDHQRVFKTREVTENGLKIDYQRALKDDGWSYIETKKRGKFIYSKNGKSVEVYTGNSKLILRDYHPYDE